MTTRKLIGVLFLRLGRFPAGSAVPVSGEFGPRIAEEFWIIPTSAPCRPSSAGNSASPAVVGGASNHLALGGDRQRNSEKKPSRFLIGIVLGGVLATAAWSVLGGGQPNGATQADQKKGWRQERNRIAKACHRERRRAELAKLSRLRNKAL